MSERKSRQRVSLFSNRQIIIYQTTRFPSLTQPPTGLTRVIRLGRMGLHSTLYRIPVLGSQCPRAQHQIQHPRERNNYPLFASYPGRPGCRGELGTLRTIIPTKNNTNRRCGEIDFIGKLITVDSSQPNDGVGWARRSGNRTNVPADSQNGNPISGGPDPEAGVTVGQTSRQTQSRLYGFTRNPGQMASDNCSKCSSLTLPQLPGGGP